MAGNKWTSDPLRLKNPTLAEIREMRAELRKLDTTLLFMEAQFSSGRPVPASSLNLKAVGGWVTSLVESYVVLLYILRRKDAERELSILKSFIDTQQNKFLLWEAGTRDLDKEAIDKARAIADTLERDRIDEHMRTPVLIPPHPFRR